MILNTKNIISSIFEKEETEEINNPLLLKEIQKQKYECDLEKTLQESISVVFNDKKSYSPFYETALGQAETFEEQQKRLAKEQEEKEKERAEKQKDKEAKYAIAKIAAQAVGGSLGYGIGSTLVNMAGQGVVKAGSGLLNLVKK